MLDTKQAMTINEKIFAALWQAFYRIPEVVACVDERDEEAIEKALRRAGSDIGKLPSIANATEGAVLPFTAQTEWPIRERLGWRRPFDDNELRVAVIALEAETMRSCKSKEKMAERLNECWENWVPDGRGRPKGKNSNNRFEWKTVAYSVHVVKHPDGRPIHVPAFQNDYPAVEELARLDLIQRAEKWWAANKHRVWVEHDQTTHLVAPGPQIG